MRDIVSKKTFLVVEWTQLPENIRDTFADNQSFSNDCLLPVYSEFGFSDYDNFDEEINSYWQDQLESPARDQIPTLEDFIREYGLEFDVWLSNYIKENSIDVTGVDKVLLNICW